MPIIKPPDTKSMIYFQQVTYDTQPYAGGVTYTFFDDSGDFDNERALKLSEQEMVNWLFNHSPAKEIIYDELKMPRDSVHFLSVEEPFIQYRTEKPGDIDVLLCHKNDPRHAIALECKRIKVSFDDSHKENINKIRGLLKGVEQANALSKLGFGRCFLFVMIVTDGHNLKEQNQMFRYASADKLKEVYYLDEYKNLYENVGVILCLVTQPSGKSIYMNGTIAVREHKIAKQYEQPAELQEKIQSYLTRK
ncbi:MAG: hypothetical protein ACLQQ4_15160 [Bacteroidia bacterium]